MKWGKNQEKKSMKQKDSYLKRSVKLVNLYPDICGGGRERETERERQIKMETERENMKTSYQYQKPGIHHNRFYRSYNNRMNTLSL